MLREQISSAAGLCAIAATALVPVIGPLSTTGAGAAFYPLIIISAIVSSRGGARAATFSAVVIVYAVVMDIFMMHVGVPGGRFSPEGAAMVLRLASIAGARLDAAMLCASAALIVATMPLLGTRALLLAICAQSVVSLNIYHYIVKYIGNVYISIMAEIIVSMAAIAIVFVITEYISKKLVAVRSGYFFCTSAALLIVCAGLMAGVASV